MDNTNLPLWLVATLRNRFSLRNFVETGTLAGDTVAAVLPLFEQVYTIEESPQLAAAARQRFAGRKVEVIGGHSPVVLHEVCAYLTGNTFFWLDAHWCGGEKLGPECPLLDEIAAIGMRPKDVLAIDDARLFIHPPPPPHDPKQWPTVYQLWDTLKAYGWHNVCLVGDVFIASPEAALADTETLKRSFE